MELLQVLQYLGIDKVVMLALLSNRIFIVALVCSLTSALSTWRVLSWKHGKQLAEIENAALEMKADNAKAKNEIDLRTAEVARLQAKVYELSKQKQKVITKYVNKEKIKYVQTPNAGKCILPPKWVFLHDTAARNNITRSSNTSSKPNDTSTKITDIDALDVVTNNYATCNETRNKLISLQQWAKNLRGKKHE